ncbi:hypothetical protein GOP47_0022760 [Adiantum capillus-veneris]|uniref:Uncharacterized protein n=1 Tax=Adiantum capillus-veneris TaxID=13818 RepID=A0A9D4U8B8_ADICA|nr:hypothetical protein GOP47_0022760 [Adiantum capillus-veneris]
MDAGISTSDWAAMMATPFAALGDVGAARETFLAARAYDSKGLAVEMAAVGTSAGAATASTATRSTTVMAAEVVAQAACRCAW